MAISTRATSGIVTDPFNPFQFASHADDALVRIWDSRKTTEPVFTNFLKLKHNY